MTPKQKDARNWARSYRCHGQPEAAARILMIHGTDEQEQTTDGTQTDHISGNRRAEAGRQ